MKICSTLLLTAPAIFSLTGCSLVTVPVKTAGGIVNTTVRTTGRVAEAPFKAASGGYSDKEKPADREKTSKETED